MKSKHAIWLKHHKSENILCCKETGKFTVINFPTCTVLWKCQRHRLVWKFREGLGKVVEWLEVQLTSTLRCDSRIPVCGRAYHVSESALPRCGRVPRVQHGVLTAPPSSSCMSCSLFSACSHSAWTVNRKQPKTLLHLKVLNDKKVKVKLPCSWHVDMLHWLPVRQRIDFKVATLVHQSLSGISPPYLADDCRLVADARERRLRSTASRTCVVTQTYGTFGDRAFGAACPGLSNSLMTYRTVNSAGR